MQVDNRYVVVNEDDEWDEPNLQAIY
jgi:hypothetical protein